MHGIEGQLKVNLGSGENDKVISIELASVTEGVRGGEGHTRGGRAKGDSETVNIQIEEKRRENSALRDAKVDPRRRGDGATKTGTTQEIGKKVPKTTRDTEVKETNQSGSTQQDSLLVGERDKSVLVTAEAQGVHEAEGHGVGTPAETALGRVELWKMWEAMRA